VSQELTKTSNQSNKNLTSTSKLHQASEYELSRTQIDQEKQIQDDYIKYKFGLHRYSIIYEKDSVKFDINSYFLI